jgi:hypothetical protein
MKNKKAVLAFILMVVIAFSACAQQYDPESDFEASTQDGGKSVMITKYVGSKWEVRIPPRIQGLPVTHIGGGTVLVGGAFSGKKLVSVTIPNSVTTIGDRAFSANQLTSVTIPNSVNTIGDGAFSANQLTSVNIPNSVTHIGHGAFSSNEQLTSVTIGNGVTSIEDSAFITIWGDIVTNVGINAFSGCPSLTTINVAAGNSAYASENGVLYNKNKTVLYKYPEGKTEPSFVIPNNVTEIGRYAFSGCTNLTSITFAIDSQLETIGYSAFQSCTGLTSIAIPASVTNIGEYAFSDCIKLAGITIPNSVINIGDHAFEGCTSLTGRFIEVLRPLADIMKDYESVPAQERRNSYDDMLSAALASQSAIDSIYTVWKPNALDGMDTRFIGRVGSSPTGMYTPTFAKENGTIEKSVFTDLNDSMAYIIGPNSRYERVEPTIFKVNGQDVWILKIEVPIINPRWGEVIGTVGGYCDIR